MRLSLLVVLFLAGGLAFGVEPVVAQETATVVYLVRHGERAEDGTSDPPLSEAGRARAEHLAWMLKDAGITAVYSSDYKRTRSTAEPVANELGLEVQLYDPRQLDAFAARLAAMSGRILVAGHSNTTPSLVELLGGDPVGTIDDAEFDRLYVVTMDPGELSVSVLLRYGAAYEGQ